MYLRRGFNFGGGAALAAWTVQIVELRVTSGPDSIG